MDSALQTLPHHGGMQLLANVPPGCCAECAVEHAPELPHNAQSLFYQYKFMGEHGRWPTWSDAMAHCTTEMKDQWILELRRMQVPESQLDGTPGAAARVTVEVVTVNRRGRRKEGV